jgi:hypothetical protein
MAPQAQALRLRFHLSEAIKRSPRRAIGSDRRSYADPGCEQLSRGESVRRKLPSAAVSGAGTGYQRTSVFTSVNGPNNQGDPPALPGRQQKFDNSGNRAPGSGRRNFELEPRTNSIDDL